MEQDKQDKQKIRLSKLHSNSGMEMKPVTPKTDEIDLLSQDEQEHVTEKLSISVPTQPLLRPTGLLAYIGQRVRLLLRDGTVVIGFLQKRQWNYVHLLNVEEITREERLTWDWCDVELGSIARVYPATAKAQQVQRP
ncbi:MAG: hypothetical protein ABSF90_00580 [Syntrophobacteraceae bacterium]|jgi:hypothetical protein